MRRVMGIVLLAGLALGLYGLYRSVIRLTARGNGVRIAVADTDHDGSVDTVLVDTNHDGAVD
jgi:hypothetical protein